MTEKLLILWRWQTKVDHFNTTELLSKAFCNTLPPNQSSNMAATSNFHFCTCENWRWCGFWPVGGGHRRVTHWNIWFLHWTWSSSLSENSRSECKVAEGRGVEEDLATGNFLFSQQPCGNGQAAVARWQRQLAERKKRKRPRRWGSSQRSAVTDRLYRVWAKEAASARSLNRLIAC